MLIVFANPGEEQSTHEKVVQLAKVRSHAATVSHRVRKQHDPFSYPRSPEPVYELRALAFYHRRTSKEWSSWSDSALWVSIAPMLAANYAGFHHGIVALGAAHEFLEKGDAGLQALSVSKAQACIAWCNDNYWTTSNSILLAFSVLLTELTCLVSRTALSRLISSGSYQQAIKAEDQLVDVEADDNFCLKPLLKRRRSRLCQLCNPLPLLRTGIVKQPVSVDVCFNTIQQARDSLESILNSLARQVKAGAPVDHALHQGWLHSLNKLKTKSNDVTWKALKVAYLISVIQIATMYAPTEMVYDLYYEDFKEVAAAFSFVAERARERICARFNVDSGFVTLVGWAAKWCRDPALRSHFIHILRHRHRLEGA